MKSIFRGVLCLAVGVFSAGAAVAAPASVPMETDYRCLQRCVNEGGASYTCLSQCRYVKKDAKIASKFNQKEFVAPQAVTGVVVPKTGVGKGVGAQKDYGCEAQCLKEGMQYGFCEQRCLKTTEKTPSIKGF